MTKHEQDIEDIKFIVDEIRRISSLSPLEVRTHIEENMNRHDFLWFIRDTNDNREYVCGQQAARKLREIADRHLPTFKERRHDLNPDQLAKLIGVEVARRFIKDQVEVSRQKVDKMLSAVEKEAKNQFKSITHYIPCVAFSIFPADPPNLTDKFNGFYIGPVHFINSTEFVKTNELEIRQSFPIAEGESNEKYVEHTDFMMTSLSNFFKTGGWVAEVTILECEEEISRLRAETTVQAALDILKLLYGSAKSGEMRLAKAHVMPADTSALTKDSSSHFHLEVNKRVSEGIVISEKDFQLISRGNDFLLQMAHQLLQIYIDPKSEVHLYRRFLDALFWYGQAISEPLPSSQIIKYVAAWERLTITKKEVNELSKKVIRRTSMLIHNLGDGDFSNAMTKVEKIYDWRSNLMHGSCTPFDKKLPAVASSARQITQYMLYGSLQMLFRIKQKLSDDPEAADLENEYEEHEKALGIV